MTLRIFSLPFLFLVWVLALSSLASAQPAVSFSPTSLSFGSVQQGSSGGPLPVVLTNTGNATLTITKIKITGANAPDFLQTNTCGTSVLAGANCTINVTFTPTKGGARSGNVSVTDNAGTGTQLVPLSGTGLAPAVTFSPPSLTLGNQLITTTSSSQSVTVTNVGQAPLTISSMTVMGANPSEFSMTQNCGSGLAVSATCTVTVTFTPTAAWTRSAAVMMVDNVLGSPHVIGLAGIGASGGVATFSPSSLTFTTRLVGTTSAAQPVTFSNTGTAPIAIASISAAGDYAQTNDCGTLLAAGAFCTVNVTFTPSYSQSRPGWINFNLIDPAGALAVSLTGGGALAQPVAVKPKAASLTFSQTQQYTAYISGVQTSAVTWYVDGVAGGNTTAGTITASGLYTPPAAAGSHTVKAVNIANANQSASVPVVVSGFAGTYTHHNDNFRTGQNNNEPALTTGNVNKNQFGKLFSQPVDGQIYGQPLWMPNVNMGTLGFHNLVIVATQHDSVYAFDADQPLSPLWQASFINPGAGVTPIPYKDVEVGLDISPEIGVTSTPVIDAARGVLFVEARTKEVSGSVTSYVHKLHALDITSGAEMSGSPVVIAASVPGTGYDNVGGVVTFNSMRQNNRSALLLQNGTVYIAFASLEDINPYHGWVLGYDAITLAQTVVFNNTPNGNKAGIWHGGGGIPADADGNLYASTGTGSFDTSKGGGITFARLAPSGNTLNVTDFFSPFNQSYLNLEAVNADFSSSGPMLLPDQPGPVPHLAIACGKTGTIYLMNRDNLGKYNATFDSVVQALYLTIGVNTKPPTGNWGTPAYFNGQIYIHGIKDPLKQFILSNALLSGGPVAVGADIVGYPGTIPVISSNGTQNGIVWVVQSDGAATSKASTLRAYDAGNVTHALYNSGLAGTRDKAGPAVKFATPTVANGKVYVPTASELDIYGLLP